MSTSLICPACQFADHDNCEVGHSLPDLIGGWRCVCDHTPETDERMRQQRLAAGGLLGAIERFAGPDDEGGES